MISAFLSTLENVPATFELGLAPKFTNTVLEVGKNRNRQFLYFEALIRDCFELYILLLNGVVNRC